jgi:hypothetical protein
MGSRKRDPTPRDLKVVIGRLQDLIGMAVVAHGNDRNPDGFEQDMDALDRAHRLCVEVLSRFKPLKPSGPWAGPVFKRTTNSTSLDE